MNSPQAPGFMENRNPPRPSAPGPVSNGRQPPSGFARVNGVSRPAALPVANAGLPPGGSLGLYIPPAEAPTAYAASVPYTPERRSDPEPSTEGRAVLGAGEPYPPLSVRPLNGSGASLMEQKRINPRSPRAALEPERVPVPTRRSKRARHPLVIAGNAFITLFILLAVGVGFALIVGKQRFEAPGPLTSDKVVNIPRGGIRDIADQLVREGVIEDPKIFMAGVLVLKAREDLKAGEYQFNKQASLRQVVETIVEYKVVQHPITIPEGLTSEQIVARLVENNVLSGNIKEIPREGTLLPDTYNFPRGFTRERIIQLMQQGHQRVLKDVWDHRNPDLPLKSPEQLVTLASIIEKETGRPEERTRVASVFVNRLKQKMKLQSDPTIIYGLVGGKGNLGRPLTRSEIDQATPYNTYAIDGLPPGPIANPGRASLEAAANPARTKELFFVADGTGGHVFSDTYEQHQKNVARLRVIEQQQKGAAVSDAAASAAAADAAAEQGRGRGVARPASKPPVGVRPQ
jgi:UPF0755 protein